MGIFIESLATEALLLLTVITYLFYRYFTEAFDFWEKLGVPFIKPTPVFGNMAPFLLNRQCLGENTADLYNAKESQNLPYVGCWFSKRPYLLLRDPEIIKHVLIKDFQSFSERGLVMGQSKEPLSAHLFNLGGWRWRVLRTKLTPTFTSGKMKYMFGSMLECTEGLEKLFAKYAETEQVIEIKEPLAKFTTDVIGTCAFGLNFQSMGNEQSEFREMGRLIFTPSLIGVIKRFTALLFPFLVQYIRLTFIPGKVSNFFQSAVNETLKYRRENNVERNDMMQLLLEVQKQGQLVDEDDKYATFLPTPKDEQGHQVFELTDELIAAQAFVFFAAGFETSSTTMSFVLYELARNQDIQDKLAEEIRRVLKDHGGVTSYEALQDMKYLDKVVSEALRRYPPVQSLSRRATRSYQLPDTNIVIPSGMRISIPVYAIQNDSKYYPNPDKFDPERFTPEMKQQRHQCTYLPFGEGPRNCIGARFGLLQTKLGLTTVLKQFKVDISSKTQIPPKLEPASFVTALKSGTYLKVSVRS